MVAQSMNREACRGWRQPRQAASVATRASSGLNGSRIATPPNDLQNLLTLQGAQR